MTDDRLSNMATATNSIGMNAEIGRKSRYFEVLDPYADVWSRSYLDTPYSVVDTTRPSPVLLHPQHLRSDHAPEDGSRGFSARVSLAHANFRWWCTLRMRVDPQGFGELVRRIE